MGNHIRYTTVLLILLSLLIGTTANAATRKHVSMPSASSVANSSGGAVSRSGNDLSIAGELIGEYIPATGTGTKGTPIKVLPTLDYSIPRTINAAKSLLKNNLAQALLGAVVAGAVASVDWVMNPENNTLQRKISDGEVQPPTQWRWNVSSTGCPGPFSTAQQHWNCFQSYLDSVDGRFNYFQTNISYNPASKVLSWTTTKKYKNGTFVQSYGESGAYVGTCTSPLFLTTMGVCVNPEKATYAPVTESDFSALDPHFNGLAPGMLRDLLKETCNGSASPEACFQEMKERSALTGPATVDGPTTTSTTNSTSPSGVTSQTVTTKATNYKIIYGDTYFDFSKKITTNISVDGAPASETEEEEGTEPTEEIPEEEEKPKRLANAGPCEGAVFCSGDAIDCAVLTQTKQHRCYDEAQGDFPKNKAGIESLISGSQFAAEPDEEIEVPTFINEGARFLPAACPPPTDIALTSFGGHSFQLKFDPICSLAELLAPLVVIFATLFAALYVGRSFGGE